MVNDFQFIPSEKLMLAEISDLQLREIPNKLSVFSPKTCNTVIFKLDSVELDRDDDIVKWIYLPLTFNERVTRLVILND